MEKEARIHIHSLQTAVGAPDGESAEPIELVVPGTLRRNEDILTVEYDEIFEGFESTPTRNRVEIREGSVEVHKAGAVHVDMVFFPDERTPCSYRTPFGVIEMETRTASVEVQQSDREIIARIRYTLAAGGEAVSDCVLDMRINTGQCQ